MAKYVWNSEKTQDYGADYFVFHNLKINPRCFIFSPRKVTHYQEWPSFRHTFSHFHLDIHPIYAEMESTLCVEQANLDWRKVMESTKEYQSNLSSAVKYWYDPQNPEPIGLAQPVKNLLIQFVRNHYGKNSIL